MSRLMYAALPSHAGQSTFCVMQPARIARTSHGTHQPGDHAVATTMRRSCSGCGSGLNAMNTVDQLHIAVDNGVTRDYK